MSFLGLQLSPDAMRTMLPYFQKAADEEWMDQELKVELENARNELIARLQHEGVYDLSD